MMLSNGSEIVKALECYRGQKLFAFNGKKPEIYIHDIIDLINRLQAENERLKKGWKDDILLTQNSKTEAYKEFAERLKHIIMWSPKNHISITAKDIDNLLKELVGE